MIVPTKHENIETNILVIASKIISFLKQKDFIIEDILSRFKKENEMFSPNKIIDALTFLYCIGVIEIDEFTVRKIV